MKSFNILKVIFILLVFSGIMLPVSARETDPTVSDSLIAGDTTIIRYQLGDYNPAKLSAGLEPNDLYYPWLCNVYKDDTIWSYKTELYENNTFDFYFAVPHGTLPGKYKMFILYEESYVVTLSPWKRVFTPPYICENPRDTTMCEGDTVNFVVKAFGNDDWDLGYIWYHNNIQMNESYDGYLCISYPQLHDTGNYYCVIRNYFGTDTSETVRLDLFPVPAKPDLPKGPERFYPCTSSTEYYINSDPAAIRYDWYLYPKTAGTLHQQDTSVLITWNPDFLGFAGLYVVLISAKCGSDSSDHLSIHISEQAAPMEICIVGIDEETGKYRIVWEKPGHEPAQLYRIYRESNQADVYLEIGSVEPDELSVFIDQTSVPDVIAHRYKISYADSCGNESELSDFHQTMHLAANLGTNNTVNLAWSEYEGIAFPAYNIYRGNHSDSLNLLIQVPSTVTSFTDTDPPLGDVYYQTGMSNPAGCNPVKKSGPDYSSSKSNMAQVNISGIEEVYETSSVKVYPNPADKKLYIQFKSALAGSVKYVVYNSLGANILEGVIRLGSEGIEVSSLSPGLYILQLSSDIVTSTVRFVVKNGND